MTTVISSVNLKGGVGKTALAVNFAAYCGRKGYRTLLIDLDPQTNATFSCITIEDWQAHAKAHGTVAELLGVRNHTSAEGKKVEAADTIISDVFKNVDLLPSHLDLFTIDLDIAGKTARETLLRKAMKDVLEEYDIVVCDCPPNLTLPTQNALAISTHFVTPVSPDFLSSLGIALLLKRVQTFGDDIERKIEHAGVVLSRVGRTSTFREQTMQSLRDAFGDAMFDAEIRERSVVTEATAMNKSVYQMSNRDAANEFRAFSRELLGRVGF